jgi:hypothetical protein
MSMQILGVIYPLNLQTGRKNWAFYAAVLTCAEVTTIVVFMAVPQITTPSLTAIAWVVAPLTTQVVLAAAMICTFRCSQNVDSRGVLLVFVSFGSATIAVSAALTVLSCAGILPKWGFVQSINFIPHAVSGFRPAEKQRQSTLHTERFGGVQRTSYPSPGLTPSMYSHRQKSLQSLEEQPSSASEC